MSGGDDIVKAMRGRFTKSATEFVKDPKLRRAMSKAAVHAAKEFVKKFSQEYGEEEPDNKGRKKR